MCYGAGYRDLLQELEYLSWNIYIEKYGKLLKFHALFWANSCICASSGFIHDTYFHMREIICTDLSNSEKRANNDSSHWALELITLKHTQASGILSGNSPEAKVNFKSLNHFGPWTQRSLFVNAFTEMLRVSKSAGFSAVFMYCHCELGITEFINSTQLHTKVWYLSLGPFSHASTIFKSKYARTDESSHLKISLTRVNRLVSKTAPSNSNLGIVSTFKGATLDFV